MLVVGIHSVESFLVSRQSEVKALMVESQRKTTQRVISIIKKAKENGVRVDYVGGSGFDQGVALEVELAWSSFSWWDWMNKANVKRVVVLDGVQDPHNLGACMRTACAFSADMVLIPSRRAAPVNATALKVAAGAGAWLPVFEVNNLNACLKSLREMGFWLVAMSEHAQEAATKVKHEKTVLIVGNEEKGVRHSVLQQADYCFKLPTTGHIKSLNVSVALGVALAMMI